MIDNWVKKGLVYAVILLFIGIAIQPAISTNTISEEKTDAKDLLFQTILDIVDNNEIQSIMQKSEIKGSPIRFQQLLGRLQKEIIGAIEKNDVLNEKIKQLQDLPCDCENNSTSNLDFPAICDILRYIVVIFGIFPYIFLPIWYSAFMIAVLLHCTWTYP